MVQFDINCNWCVSLEIAQMLSLRTAYAIISQYTYINIPYVWTVALVCSHLSCLLVKSC